MTSHDTERGCADGYHGITCCPRGRAIARERRLEGEITWLEDLLEVLQTVPGSWETHWDEFMTCGDRQEKAAEECADALRTRRERLAAARREAVPAA